MLGDLEDLGFATGTASLAALAVAWELVEYGIGTNLLASGSAGQVCDEEHYWPTGWVDYDERYRMVVLHKTRLISVDSLTVHHEDFDCSCGVTEADGCATVYNHSRSEIALGDCMGIACLCSAPATNRFKIDLCYTAGLYTTLAAFDQSVIMALGLLYSWWLALMESGGATAGSGFINSWRSMDYNESYGFIEKSVVGTSPQAAAAWQLLRRFRIKRAVVIRSHFPAQYRYARY